MLFTTCHKRRNKQKMKFVLLATHSTPHLQNTLASFALASVKPEVLGWNENWKGWKWRLEKYLDFCNTLINEKAQSLKNNTTTVDNDKEEVVAFIDAFDVLCLRQDVYPNFENLFNSFKSDIVFSSEWWCGSSLNCGSTAKFSDERTCLSIDRNLDINSKKNNKVNVGFVCGNVKSLAKMYSDVLNLSKSIPSHNNESFDDQKAISQWVDSDLSTSLRLSLDRRGLLCKTVNVFDCLEKKHKPFFAHFPGPMLKIGLFPHYNVNALSVLGQKAKLRDLYKFVYASICIIIITFIIS